MIEREESNLSKGIYYRYIVYNYTIILYKMKLNVEPEKKLNTIDELYKDIQVKGKK